MSSVSGSVPAGSSGMTRRIPVIVCGIVAYRFPREIEGAGALVPRNVMGTSRGYRGIFDALSIYLMRRNLTAHCLRGNGLQGYVPANTVTPTGATVPRKDRCMFPYIRSGQVRCAVRYIEVKWEPERPTAGFDTFGSISPQEMENGEGPSGLFPQYRFR